MEFRDARRAVAVKRADTHRRRAFTLVELLVVVAIIGVLIGILIPAVSAAREASRRTQCLNNLRQLGIALHHFDESRGYYPPGADSREYAVKPSHPHNFYRWSALAHLAPFFEQANAMKLIDTSVPLYYPGFDVIPVNKPGVAQIIPMLLCPSDRGIAVAEGFGPTNYAMCAGSGRDGGTPFDTDGLFYINSRSRFRDIIDGASNTIAISESILGDGPLNTTKRNLVNPETAYAFSFLEPPLTESDCDSANRWNSLDPRGFAWVSGEYRCALYNHYLMPNSEQFDCLKARQGADFTTRYAAYGWRAARSRHRQGVNVFFADGSARFIADFVQPEVWRAWSTRDGKEAATE